MSEQGFSVKLTARTDQYIAAMKGAQASTDTLANSGRNFDQLGSKMQDVGTTLSKSVTLPIIAVGGLAVKMSTDFEGAFAKMQGLAGVTADEVDGLKASVLDLAGQTGQAPQDLADGLYFLRSSGLSAADAMDALAVSAKASTAGLGPTAVIADAVSSAMNAYAKSGLSAAEATDILVGTARAGKAEPAELAGALGRVLPIASELGVTFEDVGGSIAALSLSGNDASTSATLLTNILSKMLKPSEQGAKLLAGVGMSADSIRASIADKGLLGTLDDLKTRLGDAGFMKFMEDAQAVQGALALTGQNADHVHTVFDQVAGSAGATGEAFAAVAETSGFKMKKAWAEVQVALIKAGDIILPIVSGVAGAIGHLAEIFSDLPGPVQTIIVGFLGLAAAAGPLLIVAGTLIKHFKEIQSVLPGIGSGAAGAASNAVPALAVIGVAAFALTQRSNHAADAIAHITKNAEDLSTVADKDVLNTLNMSIAQGIANGVDLATTMKTLAETNHEGAMRAYEMADAQDHNGQVTVALRRAIADQIAAEKQGAETTTEFGTAVDGASGSTEDLTNQTLGLSVAQAAGKGASEELAAATEDAKAKSDAFAESLKTQRERLEEAYGIERSAVQAKHDLADSTQRATEDLAALNETLKKNKAGSEESTAATDTAAKSILAASEDYATLNGAALNSDAATRRQIDALNVQAAALAPDNPLRSRLLEYIAELNRIQTDIQTRLTLNISVGSVSTAAGDAIGYGVAHGAGQTTAHALGGSASGRILVGEKGPEILDVPPGSYVHTNDASRAMMTSAFSMGLTGGSGSTPIGQAVNSTSATVNNYNQPVTVDVISRALAMARLAA